MYGNTYCNTFINKRSIDSFPQRETPRAEFPVKRSHTLVNLPFVKISHGKCLRCFLDGDAIAVVLLEGLFPRNLLSTLIRFKRYTVKIFSQTLENVSDSFFFFFYLTQFKGWMLFCTRCIISFCFLFYASLYDSFLYRFSQR